MSYPTIILTTYNRPEHTKKTFEALVRNEGFGKYNVRIYLDGAKKENDEKWLKTKDVVEECARKYPNTEVFISSENKGLANSVMGSVSDVFKDNDQVIMLEDDIVTSKYFLKYMTEALQYYKDVEEIGSISGYTHPTSSMVVPSSYEKDIYFNPRPSSWGWATWKNRWEKVDWEVKDFNNFRLNILARKAFNRGGPDMSQMLIAQKKGKIDSWAIRWAYHHFKNHLLAVYPTVSFVENIGNDGSGVHCKDSNQEVYVNEELNMKEKIIFEDEIVVDKEMLKLFRKVYSHNLEYYVRKIKSKLNLK